MPSLYLITSLATISLYDLTYSLTLRFLGWCRLREMRGADYKEAL